MKYLVFFLLSFSLIGCKTYSDDDLTGFDQKIKSYLSKNHKKCERSDSGLYYHIIDEGQGDYIKYTDRVSFTYTGKLLSGKIFDRQMKPVTFPVKDLIAGWKEIMLELKPGAKVFLVIPPQLGYGDHKLDDIPQHSVLVFDMAITKVE